MPQRTIANFTQAVEEGTVAPLFCLIVLYKSYKGRMDSVLVPRGWSQMFRWSSNLSSNKCAFTLQLKNYSATLFLPAISCKYGCRDKGSLGWGWASKYWETKRWLDPLSLEMLKMYKSKRAASFHHADKPKIFWANNVSHQQPSLHSFHLKSSHSLGSTPQQVAAWKTF